MTHDNDYSGNGIESAKFILPPPLTRRQRLRGHRGRIYRVAWVSDGLHILTASEDKSIRVWEVGKAREIRRPLSTSNFMILDWTQDGRLVATNSAMSDRDVRVRNMVNNTITWEDEFHSDRVSQLAWSPNAGYLASGSEDWQVKIWDMRSKDKYRVFEHQGEITSLAWSPNSRYLATGTGHGMDNNVRVFAVVEDKLVYTLSKGHTGAVTCLAWSPNGRYLASGSVDRTISIWDLKTGIEIAKLESHTDHITSLAFSWDGTLLASKGRDETFRLWSRSKGWKLVTIMREESTDYAPNDIAFHPKLPLLAAIADKGRSVDIWEIDMEKIHDAEPQLPLVYYSNAKVVLVGDSSAGKTCLGRALMELPFNPGAGTHGLNAWLFHTDIHGEKNGLGIKREVWLWDMAGQENYRLVHQLYLKDVAVALLVFNGFMQEPFKAVKYWNRALKKMHRTERTAKIETVKYLVEARVDQGTSNFSDDFVHDICEEEELDLYFRTSALSNAGIDELREVIRNSINWDLLPEVVSTQFFEIIRDFLKSLQEEEESQITVAYTHSLLELFLTSGRMPDAELVITDLKKQFETCIEFLESTGRMRRFRFGGLVLLRPELLSFYASAIINAAKDARTDGFGQLQEQTVWDANFPIPESGRLKDTNEEKWLLLATVDDLMMHEVAYRDEENHLIFPSQFVQENRDKFEHPHQPEIQFAFEGVVVNLYAQIVVRLARSDEFELERIARNNVQYVNKHGATFGIALSEADGYGEMLLYFSKDAEQVFRYMFELFIHSYLTEQAQPGTFKRRRLFTCPNCLTPFATLQVDRANEMQLKYIDCPICRTPVSLLDPPIGTDMEKVLRASRLTMNRSADQKRRQEAAATLLGGKKATGNYDVLAMYNTSSEQDYLAINDRKGIGVELENRGIYMWNEGAVTIAQAWQDVLPLVKSVTVFIGEEGVGPFDPEEIMEFAEHCVKIGKPFIFVILPNANNIPQHLYEMREGVNWVYFFRSTDESSGLDDLEKWITGISPR